MTVKNILADQIIARIGRESTYGTAATSMKRIALSGRQQPLGQQAVEMLQSEDLGLYRHDANAPVRGLGYGSPASLKVEVKAIPTRLTSSASPVDASHADALSHTILYDHWLGGTSVAAGSTVAASPSPAVGGCTVASGHGSRFSVGQVVLIGGEPRVITAVSTDAITWSPDLSAAPSSGDVIANTFTHYRAEAQTQSLTIEQAYYETGSTEAQSRSRGVVGQCEWAAEMGKLGTLAFAGKAAAVDLPQDLSISVTEAADDMGASIRWDGIAYLFAAATTTAPSHVCVTSAKIAVPNTWEMIRCGAAENTVAAAVATGGRRDPVTVEMSLRFDADLYTGFTADTVYRAILFTRQGSGSSQRVVGWHFPSLRMMGVPKQTEQNGLIYLTVTFVALQSTITSGSDKARSPASLFLG